MVQLHFFFIYLFLQKQGNFFIDFLDWLWNCNRAANPSEWQHTWKLKYHRNAVYLCKRCLKSFSSLNALLVLTEPAHTSGQCDVRDFLINLGKRSQHLPWASVSESIVEHTGRKQMMVLWPHGALKPHMYLILYNQRWNTDKPSTDTGG